MVSDEIYKTDTEKQKIIKQKPCHLRVRVYTGADDEARTRYLNLGKVALYQMSYIRIFTCFLPPFLTTIVIITHPKINFNSFFIIFLIIFLFTPIAA